MSAGDGSSVCRERAILFGEQCRQKDFEAEEEAAVEAEVVETEAEANHRATGHSHRKQQSCHTHHPVQSIQRLIHHRLLHLTCPDLVETDHQKGVAMEALLDPLWN